MLRKYSYFIFCSILFTWTSINAQDNKSDNVTATATKSANQISVHFINNDSAPWKFRLSNHACVTTGTQGGGSFDESWHYVNANSDSWMYVYRKGHAQDTECLWFFRYKIHLVSAGKSGGFVDGITLSPTQEIMAEHRNDVPFNDTSPATGTDGTINSSASTGFPCNVDYCTITLTSSGRTSGKSK